MFCFYFEDINLMYLMFLIACMRGGDSDRYTFFLLSREDFDVIIFNKMKFYLDI